MDGALKWKQLDRNRAGLLAYAGRRLVLMDGEGAVFSLPKSRQRWKRIGTLPGAPAALSSDLRGKLIAATQQGRVYTSSNGGRRWSARAFGNAG